MYLLRLLLLWPQIRYTVSHLFFKKALLDDNDGNDGDDIHIIYHIIDQQQ